MDDSDITRNRHRGSPESRAAHEKLRKSDQLSAQRRAVLDAFRRHLADGLTAFEAIAETGLSYTSLSARFSELKKMGMLHRKQIGTDRRGAPVYERRLTKSDCTAAVHVLCSI
jgi:hypothetical protein